MKNAFVTGASGFIGRHLVSRLVEHGYHVRCLVRPTSSVRHLKKCRAELVYGDVSQPAFSLAEGIRGCQVVFHLAGLTCSLRASEMNRINGQGTAHLAEACSLQATPPVLLLTSSIAAAGPAPPNGIRKESDAPAPVSVYGNSKRLGEIAAERWADRVPVTIVRPGIVYGPWNREMLPMFRSILWFRLHAIPTFAPPPLSLIHVSDLVSLLIRAAERGQRLDAPRGCGDGRLGKGYYFGCADEYPTYLDLGRLIARLAGQRHVVLLHLAEPLPWLVAFIAELGSQLRGKPDLLNLDKIREAITPSWAMSTAAIKRDLSFAPEGSLEQRMEETLRWYRDRGWL